jgi:hypothetical protein
MILLTLFNCQRAPFTYRLKGITGPYPYKINKYVDEIYPDLCLFLLLTKNKLPLA